MTERSKSKSRLFFIEILIIIVFFPSAPACA